MGGTSGPDEDRSVGRLAGLDVHHCLCVLFIAIVTAFAFPRQAPLKDLSLVIVFAPLIAVATFFFTFVALAPWTKGFRAILRYLRVNFVAGIVLTAVVWLVRLPFVIVAA